MECPGEANLYRQKAELVVASGWENLGRKWRMIYDGYGVSFWCDENVLKWIVLIATQLCASTEATELCILSK